MLTAEVLHCFCYGQCSLDNDPGICQVPTGGKCFAALTTDFDDESETPVKTFGCIAKEMAMLQVTITYRNSLQEEVKH